MLIPELEAEAGLEVQGHPGLQSEGEGVRRGRGTDGGRVRRK